MITIVVENQTFRSHCSYDDRMKLNVLDAECICMIHEHHIKLFLTGGLTLLDHQFLCEDGECFQIQNAEGMNAVIMVKEHEDGYENYLYYEIHGQFTIGSSIDDDIYIQNTIIPKHGIQICFNTKKITVQGNDMVARNHHVCHASAPFHTGDILEFDWYRIVFLPNGIMINTVGNISCTLARMQKQNQKEVRFAEKKEIVKVYDRIPELQTFYLEKYEIHSLAEPFGTEQSLVLRIGPSLMMASASLTTGIISSIRAIENGREILDFLPMLIIPFVMMGSALLWTPLSMRADKKAQKKKLAAHQKEIALTKEQYLSSMEAWIHQYEEICDKYYPAVSDICKSVMEQHRIYVPEFHQRALVRIGRKQNVFSCKEDSNMDMDMQSCFAKEEPYIINLLDYHLMQIQSVNHGFTFLTSLLMQLSRGGCLIALIVSEADLAEYYWIVMIQNAYWNGRLLCFDSMEELMKTMSGIEEDYLVVVLRDMDMMTDDFRAHVIYLSNTEQSLKADMTFLIDENRYFLRSEKQETEIRYEYADPQDCMKLLYALAEKQTYQTCENDFFALHHAKSVSDLHIKERWETNDIQAGLEALIGIDSSGREIKLNLHEKFDGPHGLIAGMTGSGKSEFLLNLLLSLAVSYPCKDLQFVLVDFKGGGLSQVLSGCPHTASVLTNLDEECMDKALIALQSEIKRREKCIREMNQVKECAVMNLNDYRKEQRKDSSFENISELMIVVDEFAELKKERPDFLQALISIARIGRSLGIHLILATQKPTGVIDDQIRSNMSFKVCLKVAERQDSYEVLHRDDAYDLQETGMLILERNHSYVKGKGGYTNALVPQDTIFLQIMNSRNQVIYDAAKNHQHIQKQIQSVMNALKNLHAQVPPLWNADLKQEDWSIPHERFAFARADDYLHMTQNEIKLDTYGSSLFVSLFRNEKKSLLMTLFCSALKGIQKEDELYIVDDLKLHFKQQFPCSGIWCDVCNAYETDKLHQLNERITMQKSHDVICIMTDISRFISAHETHAELIKNWIENAEEYHLKLVLFANHTNAVSLRILSLIPQRYSLMNLSAPDVQQLFECSTKKTQRKAGFGLLYHEQVMEWRWFVTKEEDICNELAKQNGIPPNYSFLEIPEKISFQMYRGSAVPLGIDTAKYAWLEIRKNETIDVVSLYAEETEAFHDALKSCLPKDVFEKCFVFYTLEDYKLETIRHEKMLWIGSGYAEQYSYRCHIRSLKENEGILFDQRKRVKIQIVERV